MQALLERYFELLPQVCGCEAEGLHWKRLLFAGQPCYRSAPTQPQFDRVLQVQPEILHPDPSHAFVVLLQASPWGCGTIDRLVPDVGAHSYLQLHLAHQSVSCLACLAYVWCACPRG